MSRDAPRYPAGTLYGDLERLDAARRGLAEAVADALLTIPGFARLIRWLADA